MFVVLCVLMFAIPAVWAIAYSSYDDKKTKDTKAPW